MSKQPTIKQLHSKIKSQDCEIEEMEEMCEELRDDNEDLSRKVDDLTEASCNMAVVICYLEAKLGLPLGMSKDEDDE